jgi:hypothetical protein
LRGAESISRLEFKDEAEIEVKLDDIADVRKHQANGTPMHPSFFEKQITNKVFTNGSDHPKVIEAYRREYEAAKGAKNRSHSYVTWSHDLAKQYTEVLEECDALECFKLEDCTLEDADKSLEVQIIPDLLKALSGAETTWGKQKRLREISIRRCGISDEGVKNILALNCEWPTLSSLVLEVEHLTDASAKILEASLRRKMPALEKLRLKPFSTEYS